MGNSYSDYWEAEGLSFNLTNLVSHREECFQLYKLVADIRPHGRISQAVPLIYCPLLRELYLADLTFLFSSATSAPASATNAASVE